MTNEDYNILEAIQNTNSPLEKIALLKQASVTLKEVLFYTYNSFYRYWIKKFDTVLEDHTSNIDCWDSAKSLLDKLRERKITGDNANEAIIQMLLRQSSKFEQLFRKVLERDLGIGVGTQLLLNAFGKDFLPMFEVMKAKKYEDYTKELLYPIIVEPKLDGVRCIAVKDGKNVTLWSRRGHLFENYPQIVEEIKMIEGDFVLDGELVSRQSYQNTMKQVRRKYEVDTKSTLYTIFDGFDLDKWNLGIKGGSIDIPQMERSLWLDLNIGNHVGDNLELVPHYYVGSWDEVNKFYSQFLDEGYEGAMIKLSNGKYEFKRSWNWLKMKPTDTLDLRVVEVVEGEGKYTGMMGALVVELLVVTGGPANKPDGSINYSRATSINTVNIGGGYSDEERNRFWKIKDSMIGRLIEVKYDKVTKNESGGFSLRFPRFVKIRDDKVDIDIVEWKE